MNLFFDTSAFVKFFDLETGSNFVTELILNPDHNLFISELAVLEFHSAILRKVRTSELEKSEMEIIIKNFNNDLQYFHIEKIHDSVIQEAKNLILKYGEKFSIKTLDSIHLASYNLIYENGWKFIATDEKLCRVATELGFDLLIPID